MSRPGGGDPLGPLVVVVGSGGVGKTTLAAALGLMSAEAGVDTLVMTFDPSQRLKDTLGVGDAARDREVDVAAASQGVRGADVRGADVPRAGVLRASLLDARSTFDRLVERYSGDPAERDRILGNRYYNDLAGNLAGILEYMAVERLFEVHRESRYGRVILDTPPTRQALDFLEAPSRIVGFLESGALKIALKPWFDDRGRLRPAAKLGALGRKFEAYLDDVVGLDLLRDMGEFFQAFAPLYEGFRERALEVEALLRSRSTRFVLVAGPGEEKIPDALFFARRLEEAGYHLGPVMVNRIHPYLGESEDLRESVDEAGNGKSTSVDGTSLLRWLGDRDRKGLAELEKLLAHDHPLVPVPLLRSEPTDLGSLSALAGRLRRRLRSATGSEGE